MLRNVLHNCCLFAFTLAFAAVFATCFTWALRPRYEAVRPETTVQFRIVESQKIDAETKAVRLEAENWTLRKQLADAETRVHLLRVWGSLHGVPPEKFGPFVDVPQNEMIPPQNLPTRPVD